MFNSCHPVKSVVIASLLTLVCEEWCYCWTVELQQVDDPRSSTVCVQVNTKLPAAKKQCTVSQRQSVFVLYIALFQAGLINWSRCVVISELCARCPAIGPAAAGWSSNVRVPLRRQKLWQKVTSVQGLLCNWFCVVSSLCYLYLSFVCVLMCLLIKVWNRLSENAYYWPSV